MKTNATLNSAMPPDIRTCPPELRVASTEVLRHVVPLMSLHGIRSIVAEITQIGARAIVTSTHTAIHAISPPEAIMDIRQAAADALANYLTLWGIHSIELVPSDEDLKTLAEGYTQLKEEARKLSTSVAPKSPPVGDPEGKPLALPEGLDSE